ncbi:hypothetical protein GA0070622_1705 [Micromonospora sediminicola]|uniref:MYXO-CTERM domain-containing protein n=1 Tax=Micromonospora sediminicola TaxID=946078 RepID=A0A1A9B6K4_9ACTN|nr:hypothetical protein [Micromonospora sediminicola]SBT64726.1 hypothetical protein GA0070622_1705 [Micromonospora sediminicola]
MAKKMLGKVVAGAALGGAGLLVFTPGMAYAGGHDEGKVIAKPHVVKAGDTVELLEICSEPQEHASVWSKVTGKVDLHPARDGEHGDWSDKGGDWSDKGGDWSDGGWDADQGPDGKDGHGREDHGKGPEGKDDHGKDERGKDDHGKGEQGKGDQGKDEHGPGGNGMPQPPADVPQPGGQPGGMGGGVAADHGDQADWQGHEEYGQDAEPGWEKEQPGRDAADWAMDEHGKDGKDGHGRDAKDEHGAWQDGKDDHGKDDYAKDEHGKDWQSGGEYGRGGDEYGRGGDEYGRGGDEAGWEHGKDFVYYGEATVSEHARPGRYELRGSCGEGELVVLPRGGVDGGDGGMATTGVDRGLATGGAGMIGAAALGGLVLLRRRRAGGLV